MKTYTATPSTIRQEWFVVDAKDKILGRLASEIAKRLKGKHKAQYTPHMDVGDYIIVVNASQVRVTGNKMEQKVYYRHSGYPGGLKSKSLQEVMEKTPDDAIKLAVKGMLPKGPLGRAMFKKLKVFSGSEHSHTAQQPKILNLS